MNKLKFFNLKSLSYLFFSITLLELFLMGSGQMLKIGPITARMMLYGLALFSSVFFIILYKPILHSSIILISTFFCGLLILGSLIGIASGNDSLRVLTDIKPLLYMLMIIPFSLLIKDINTIFLVTKLIKYAGVIMAIIYLIVLLLMFIGYLDFMTIYNFMNEPDTDAIDSDIMFGSEESGRIFYKGFLYLNISFLFFLYNKSKIDKIFALFILSSIVMSSTRGFLLGLGMVIIAMAIVEIKRKRSFFILVGTSILAAFLLPFYISFIGDRSDSDIVRYMQIDQVIDAITVPSIFFGHGFGMGVPIRPDSMEITYFEILHKQGMLGLFFWLGLLAYILYNYTKIRTPSYKEIARPFAAGALFVYFQSLTNPFINNPIGMSMVLLTLITLLVIRKLETNKVVAA